MEINSNSLCICGEWSIIVYHYVSLKPCSLICMQVTKTSQGHPVPLYISPCSQGSLFINSQLTTTCSRLYLTYKRLKICFQRVQILGHFRKSLKIWEQLVLGRDCHHLLRYFMEGTWQQGCKLRSTSRPSVLCCRRDSWRWCWITTRVGEPRRQGRWWWVKGAMS